MILNPGQREIEQLGPGLGAPVWSCDHQETQYGLGHSRVLTRRILNGTVPFGMTKYHLVYTNFYGCTIWLWIANYQKHKFTNEKIAIVMCHVPILLPCCGCDDC